MCAGGVPAAGEILWRAGEEGADGGEDEGRQGDEVPRRLVQEGNEFTVAAWQGSSLFTVLNLTEEVWGFHTITNWLFFATDLFSIFFVIDFLLPAVA